MPTICAICHTERWSHGAGIVESGLRRRQVEASDYRTRYRGAFEPSHEVNRKTLDLARRQTNRYNKDMLVSETDR